MPGATKHVAHFVTHEFFHLLGLQHASSGCGGGANGQVLAANQSAITDLSKLGKAGTHFVHDFFLPGTQLTFKQTDAKKIASIRASRRSRRDSRATPRSSWSRPRK